jgi:hypothetical protein
MHNVTIVIPTTNISVANRILNSYLESGISNQIYAQFVYLINSKVITINSAKRENFDSYELLYINADRYFGSCEENIYRAQDFSSCFKEYIFCIGDGDILNWESLLNALNFVYKNNLDACAWNILHRQVHDELGFSEQNSIDLMEINSNSNQFVKLLFDGEILPASIGFPALLSTFGPVDWAAYLGNHLFKKNVFESIISYRFNENVYSFVFKQVQYFSDNPSAKYGFFNESVISRVADEYVKLKLNSNKNKITWLEDHRLVIGGSAVFWISLIDYLNLINNDYFFDIIVNSYMYSHVPSSNYEISVNYHPTLLAILFWCQASLDYKINGGSYYLGPSVNLGSLYEIRYISCFLKKFKVSFERLSTENESIIALVNKSQICLSLYLASNHESDTFLIHAKDAIANIMNLCDQSLVINLHLNAFNTYLGNHPLLQGSKK